MHPPQPWRDLLGATIRSAVTSNGVGDNYTYGRTGRRSASLPGVILPSLRRRPPRVSVVIDTSGSVSDDELGSALLESRVVTTHLRRCGRGWRLLEEGMLEDGGLVDAPRSAGRLGDEHVLSAESMGGHSASPSGRLVNGQG